MTAPPGFYLLESSMHVRAASGDLIWNGEGWSPIQPFNIGSGTNGLYPVARAGEGRRSIIFNRPSEEDFVPVTAIDRAALTRFARGEEAKPGLFWECVNCGQTYQKGTAHRCGESVAS